MSFFSADDGTGTKAAADELPPAVVTVGVTATEVEASATDLIGWLCVDPIAGAVCCPPADDDDDG